MTQEIKLPDPDTHCWDDEAKSPRDVWSYSPALVRKIIEADRAQRGEPVLWRYRDSEQCIKPLDGYTPGEGWTPLYTAPQPERKHTEAEVQELMEFAKHHALGTFSDATIEDKFRRVLGVPKP